MHDHFIAVPQFSIIQEDVSHRTYALPTHYARCMPRSDLINRCKCNTKRSVTSRDGYCRERNITRDTFIIPTVCSSKWTVEKGTSSLRLRHTCKSTLLNPHTTKYCFCVNNYIEPYRHAVNSAFSPVPRCVMSHNEQCASPKSLPTA